MTVARCVAQETIAKGGAPNQRLKLTGTAIPVSRGMKDLQAAPAAYPYRSTLAIPWRFARTRGK
jgi:hypothetical protein